MKNIMEKLSFGLVLLAMMAFAKAGTEVFVSKIIDAPQAREVKLIETEIEPVKIEIDLKDHTSFLNAIGNKESSNRYDVVNRLGYLGKYQFGRNTLKSLDIKTTKKEFLSNPDLQEEAMDRLLTENYKSLRRYINKYEGTVHNGVYITKSGVLAAAHLGGAGNVRRWFRRGADFQDANGTSIVTYMKKFSGYNLDL